MTSGRTLAEAAFATVDSTRGEALAQFITPHSSFTFGNPELPVSRAATATTVGQFRDVIDGPSRLIADVRKKDSSALVRLSSTHNRKGGSTAVLPCPNVRQRDTSTRNADHRSYLDVNAVFA